MERLMLLHVQAQGAPAEVSMNGLPIATLGPQGGRLCLPVHEYALAGRNRLSMRVGPAAGGEAPPKPMVSQGRVAIRVVLALCNQGQSPVDPNARVLSQMAWSPGLNEKHDWPFVFNQDVELPVTFPRWRWLDAPVIDLNDALARQALDLVQQLALDLQLGSPDSFLLAARLRTEELALAYQRPPAAWNQGIREHIQQLFEAQALTVLPPEPADLVLRPVAQGRLVECLAADGGPALRTQPSVDPAWPQVFWPLRLAQVEGKLYVLR